MVSGDYIYHVGGNQNSSTPNVPFEEWKYDAKNDNFTITVSNAQLLNYFAFPETFIVDIADYNNCI